MKKFVGDETFHVYQANDDDVEERINLSRCTIGGKVVAWFLRLATGWSRKLEETWNKIDARLYFSPHLTTLLAARARDFSLDLETPFAVTDGLARRETAILLGRFLNLHFHCETQKPARMEAEFRLRKLSFSEIIEATIAARRFACDISPLA